VADLSIDSLVLPNRSCPSPYHYNL